MTKVEDKSARFPSGRTWSLCCQFSKDVLWILQHSAGMQITYTWLFGKKCNPRISAWLMNMTWQYHKTVKRSMTLRRGLRRFLLREDLNIICIRVIEYNISFVHFLYCPSCLETIWDVQQLKQYHKTASINSQLTLNILRVAKSLKTIFKYYVLKLYFCFYRNRTSLKLHLLHTSWVPFIRSSYFEASKIIYPLSCRKRETNWLFGVVIVPVNACYWTLHGMNNGEIWQGLLILILNCFTEINSVCDGANSYEQYEESAI